MIKSIVVSIIVSLAVFSPYFAFQAFVRGNPNPLRRPPRRGFKELDDAVASARPDAAEPHNRLIFYEEISVFAALFGMVILFVSLAFGDIFMTVVGWLVAGLSSAANRWLWALDAGATGLAFRRRNLLWLSPFVYLAGGPEAQQQERWLYLQAIVILVFSAALAAFLLLLM